MKNEWKKELPAAVLAGGICGIVTLFALVFLAPEKWYMAIFVAIIMSAAALWKAVSDREKNVKRYKRDEKLIKNLWFCSAEGYIRTDSDRAAKFFFGPDGITVLSYKNVKPVVEFVEKEKISGSGKDRCGWVSFVIKDEKRRLVVPKENTEKLMQNLAENDWK